MATDATPRSTPVRILVGLARLVWTVVVVLVPLAGVWVASSLAAFANGPVWLAVLAGALAFPLLPLAWELVSELLRRRAQARGPKRLSELRTRGGGSAPEQRGLSVWDRLILRTLAVNLVFVGGLLWSQPASVYAAVSARGDWMLDGVEADWADRARAQLHAAAERFEWLHERTHANEYVELVDPSYSAAEVAPEPPPATGTADSPAPVPVAELAEAVAEARYPHWPQADQPHPLIVDMPAEAEVSIAAVAAYVVAHEPDPRQRVKALHDWVATRVRYDLEAAEVGPIPPQDAESTFTTRTSVCAGYANLLAALITEAGGHAVVVTGDARGRGLELSGEGHAWNAVELDGEWTLIDATWDAGGRQQASGRWEFEYGSDYLFVPPEVIGLTHFPDDPRWQLRAEPLTRGEFLRQPVLRPRFYAQGFDLIRPDRSQVSVTDEVELELGNREGLFVVAGAIAPDGSRHDCEIRGRATIEVACTLPGPGQYEVQLFANHEAYGSFRYLGSLQVNASG